MTRASLSALRRVITVDWPARQQAEARAHLLRIARQGHADIMAAQTARAGIAPDAQAYANRPGQRNLDAVQLPGPIVFDYDYRREIVAEALRLLIEASPRQSGAYAAAHTVFIDGVPVAELPARIPESAEIMIVNPLPYTRRLEIGKTKSGRDFVLQVPNRIYERVCKTHLMPRYGNAARIEFDYVQLPDAYIAKGRLSPWYQTTGAGGLGRRSRKAGKLHRRIRDQKLEAQRLPAIVITSYRVDSPVGAASRAGR